MEFNDIIDSISVKPYYLDRDAGQVIYCSDCRDILPLIPDKSIDLVLTSPPYDDLRTYVTYEWLFEDTAIGLYKCLSIGGVIVWVVGDAYINGSESGSSFKQALYFKELGLNLHDTMIYVKDSCSSPQSNRYQQMFEYMFVFSKGKPATFNPIKIPTRGYKPSKSNTRRTKGKGELKPFKYKQGKDSQTDSNVWLYGVGYMKSAKQDYIFEHPAIFPEALALDHIISWSNAGGLILDPFLGSGTTAYCAKKLGRKCIGIEISEDYCRIAAQRCAQAVLPLEVEQVKQGQGVSKPTMFSGMTLTTKGNKIRGKMSINQVSEETDRE
uniref:site-specific DNA-methyltransferase (cytosine-N(4)-specific) n=1 Tax=viral metagenome TaxID=1070528 RepID=A0A6M3LFF5_9ZZZZ